MSAQTNECENPAPILIRVDAWKCSLIDAAVELLGSDRASFMLDAACRRAEEVIMNRPLFVLSDEAFDRFEHALEQNALKDNKYLQKLMSQPPRWS